MLWKWNKSHWVKIQHLLICQEEQILKEVLVETLINSNKIVNSQTRTLDHKIALFFKDQF
jgi:hypothetical protein